MKTTQSLPGIQFVGYVPAELLQRQIMYKYLSGLKVGVFTDVKPIRFVGTPTCDAVSSYNNNGRIEQTTLRFSTLDELPIYKHVAYIVIDCNEQAYIIGQREKPRPIVKVSADTGTPDGDPALKTVEVILYAQKSLIPCSISM